MNMHNTANNNDDQIVHYGSFQDFINELDCAICQLYLYKCVLRREINNGHDEARDAFGELCRGISDLEEMRLEILSEKCIEDIHEKPNVCSSEDDLIRDTPRPSMRHVLI